ncbi:MAG: D-sedoheptulose-7-phosphate isomerase [Phycisphaerales bacterium]
MTDHSAIQNEFEIYAKLAGEFAGEGENASKVYALARACAESIRAGGKLLAIGNGGSCADAVHLCEELTGRYRDDRPSIPAMACADAGHITCVGNDYGFDSIFSRWIEGVGREKDILVALSTSGNSANIIKGVQAAKAKGIFVATLLGKDGGELAGAGDIEWVVPGKTSDRIQELHMLILHALVGEIERAMGY